MDTATKTGIETAKTVTKDCFGHKFYLLCIKMEFQKIPSFLDTTSDDKYLPRFVTKKWIEVNDQSGENHNVSKEIKIKKSMLRSDLCDFSDVYIVLKELLLLLIQIMQKEIKLWHLTTMQYLSTAFQKLIA